MRIARRFDLEAPIGGGSMGEVWLARDRRLGSRVAVKILRERLATDPWALQRFFAEARIAARLETRNVVRVLDFGVAHELPFVVMEYLEGETLASRLRRVRSLSPSATLRVLAPIGRTLARAHAMGVVHRDVKPDNVFLAFEDDGRVTPKLLDFGVAKILGDEMSEPELASLVPARCLDETDDRILGTPPYMAPEQCASIPDATPASDQWAFAVMAYQCLTGSLPFPRLPRDAMYRMLRTARFTPPSKACRGLPPDLDRWMRTALAVDPSLRFPTLLASIDALGSVLSDEAEETLDGEPILTPPPPPLRSRVASGAMTLMGWTFVTAAAVAASHAWSTAPAGEVRAPGESRIPAAHAVAMAPQQSQAQCPIPPPPVSTPHSEPLATPATSHPAHTPRVASAATSYRDDPY